MWHDEVSYAETIREKRKLYSTGLVLVAGLGVYRITWYRRADEISVVNSVLIVLAVKALLLVGGVMFFCGGYMLFTERPILRIKLYTWCRSWKALKPLRAKTSRVGRFCRRHFHSALKSSSRRGRASDQMRFDLSRAGEVLMMSEAEATLWSTLNLAVAREYLAASNQRVNKRITRGVLFMVAGYAMLGLAILAYILAVAVVSR